MNRLLAIALLSCLLVASIGTASLLAKKLYDQRRDFAAKEESLRLAAKAAQVSFERREAALVASSAARSATRAAAASAGAQLQAATGPASAWASAQVPEEVRNALGQ